MQEKSTRHASTFLDDTNENINSNPGTNLDLEQISRNAHSQESQSYHLVRLIATAADDRKAEDIMILHVGEISYLADYSDSQARDLTKLDFHFNACLLALNLAKLQAWRIHQSSHPQQPFVFSMASYKRLALNHHLLERFISLLDLEPTIIKSHPNFHKLCSYGAIAV